MRPYKRVVAAPGLGLYLAGAASGAYAACDPAQPVEPIASRFEIHGDTVYDKRTGLTWMRCSYGQEWTERGGCSGVVKLLDWNSAMGLHWRGKAVWRLPERDELQSIVATSCRKPAINETVFPGTPSIQYWTSTASGPSYSWVVFFRTGMSTWNFLKTTPIAVRLVSTGR
jgi:hypothetical protein